jgi:glycerol uptake facilitator-like aquaporin
MSNSVSKFLPYIVSAIIGAIVAITTVVVGHANASVSSEGRVIGGYQLMQHSNPTAVAGVFRINTTTGNVSYCYVDQSGRAVNCTAETQ